MPDNRIPIRETFMKPTPEYPDGSYLREVNGEVEMATGYFAKQHPGKPSPYWHGKAPVVMMDVIERKEG